MCGIIGCLVRENKFNTDLEKDIYSLTELLKCRGPDNINTYFERSDLLVLGHTRLSIIDLSPDSNQPINSKCNRFIISFNGEIYNFKKLCEEFLGNDKEILKSDTMVLIELISKIGVENAFSKLEGMFAIAVFDRQDKNLYLARDYYGKKPLYYYFDKNQFFFSSTLKPIIKNKNIKKKINSKSLQHYFHYGFCPSSESIFDNVAKIEPNSFIKININKWKLEKKKIFITEHKEIYKAKNINYLENLLIESVKKRLISDVPICLLLSSGIDSSLIAYYASKLNQEIETYTVGFENSFFDESKQSKKIAKYLGLKNTTLIVNQKEMKNIISELPDAFDEPFADSSQIPTMSIFKEISKRSKVCLTGDGGDEIFYGYNRYQWFLIWKIFFKNNFLINKYSKNLTKFFINLICNTNLGNNMLNKYDMTHNKLLKFLNIFFEKKNVYEKFIRLSDAENPIIQTNNLNHEYLKNISDLRNSDIENYLSNDILTKIDRSSMHYSIEARSPFLDKNILNYLQNFSEKDHIDIFNKKKILKKILKDKLPESLINPKKKGFALPIIETLKFIENDLINEFYNLKRDNRLISINFEIVKNQIDKYFKGSDYTLSQQIWCYYVFFKWFQKYQNYIDS